MFEQHIEIYSETPEVSMTASDGQREPHDLTLCLPALSLLHIPPLCRLHHLHGSTGPTPCTISSGIRSPHSLGCQDARTVSSSGCDTRRGHVSGSPGQPVVRSARRRRGCSGSFGISYHMRFQFQACVCRRGTVIGRHPSCILIISLGNFRAGSYIP
jgi:hypothetical protein